MLRFLAGKCIHQHRCSCHPCGCVRHHSTNTFAQTLFVRCSFITCHTSPRRHFGSHERSSLLGCRPQVVPGSRQMLLGAATLVTKFNAAVSVSIVSWWVSTRMFRTGMSISQNPSTHTIHVANAVSRAASATPRGTTPRSFAGGRVPGFIAYSFFKNEISRTQVTKRLALQAYKKFSRKASVCSCMRTC